MTEHRNLISLIRYFLPCLVGIRSRWAQAALLLALPSLFGAGLLWAVKLLIDEVFVAQQFDHLPLFWRFICSSGSARPYRPISRAGSTPR
jgi:hypothetical protein